MTYQAPPYQTTVMQPVTVQPVQPVVVPIVSGPGQTYQGGPAFIRKGAKLCGFTVPGQCICCMSIFGVIMVIVNLPMLIITSGSGISSIATFPFMIGLPIAIISCYLCVKAKQNYDEQRNQENTAPCSEPFTEAGNSSGRVYSRQGVPAFEQSAVASPMYVPVPSQGPPTTVYPQGSVVSYPNTASSVSYPAQMYAVQQPQPGYAVQQPPQPGYAVQQHPQPGYAVQQPPQPGFNPVPDAVPYPGHPSYSIPNKGFVQEYDQQPAQAPPPYTP